MAGGEDCKENTGKRGRNQRGSGKEGGRRKMDFDYGDGEGEGQGGNFRNRCGEVRRFWKVEMDEDLSMKKRRRRWKMVEAAKREKARGRKVEINNREMWVDGKKWVWNREHGSWVDKVESEDGRS